MVNDRVVSPENVCIHLNIYVAGLCISEISQGAQTFRQIHKFIKIMFSRN